MGAAKYVGRVGALAVALGIGSAVAAAPAWAEPSETNSAPSSPTSDNAQSEPERPSGTSTDDNPSTAATPPSPTTSEPSVDSDLTESISNHLDDAERPKPRVLKRNSRPQSIATSTSTTPDEHPGPNISLPRTAVTKRSSVLQPTAPAVTPTAAMPTAAQAGATAPDPVPDVTASNGADAAVAVEAVVAGSSATPGGDVPVQSPAEWALLAAARREIGTDRTGNTAIAAQTTSAQPVAAAASAGPPTYWIGTALFQNYAERVVVSPDGTRLYVTSGVQGTLSVIDTATNKTVGAPIPIGSYADDLVVSPDGTRVYVANGREGTVSVIDTATNRTVGAPIPIENSAPSQRNSSIGLVVSPDGTRVYATSSIDGTLSVIDTATNKTVGAPIPVGYWTHSPAITPDGTRVYFISRETTVSMIDTATNTPYSVVIPAGIRPIDIAVGPSGTHIYVTATQPSSNGSSVGIVLVVDTATNKTVGAPIMLGKPPLSGGVAVSPDGTRIYLINDGDGQLSVIDVATGAAIGTPIQVWPNSVNDVAVSPDGTRVYVAVDNWVDSPGGLVQTGAVVVIDSGQVVSTPGGTGSQDQVTVEKLFATMRPETTDTIRAELRVDSNGTKRMVVYMSGIDGDSFLDGLIGNTGARSRNVSEFIDKAARDWQPMEIMLVGLSNGGQQMQNYAATGAHRDKVTVMVLLGAAPTKKTSEISGVASLLISDLGDTTWTKATVPHRDALDSYDQSASDKWSWYVAGKPSTSDTHGVDTYKKAAKAFDEYATTSGSSAGDKLIYGDMQRFNGTVQSQRSAPTSPGKIAAAAAQAAFKAAQSWVSDRVNDFRAGVKAAGVWVQDRVKDVQRGANSIIQGVNRVIDNVRNGRWFWE